MTTTRKQFAIFIILVTIVAIISAISGTAADFQPAATVQPATINVSGMVTSPGGPVPNVPVIVASPIDWQSTTTDNNGHYSVNIEHTGELWFYIRPAISTRLTHINLHREDISGDLTQDFSVTNGKLLEIALDPSVDDAWLNPYPLFGTTPEGQWYSLDKPYGEDYYQNVLPPDVYYVTVTHLPGSYFETTKAFDLRTSDVVGDMTLNTQLVNPIPYDPPDATKITFGPVDGLGESSIIGAAGAAIPFAHVRLVNLNSSHVTHVISEADGSFSARLFAPPGSEVMVRHGPPHWHWDINLDENADLGVLQFLNAYPNTIIHRSLEHEGNVAQIPFASAGGFEVNTANIPFDVGAAFAITGTIGPLVVDGAWTHVLSDTFEGAAVPGLYLGGLNHTHPTFGDLDDDGDLELLIGVDPGELVLFENEGTSEAPDWQFQTGDYVGVNTGWWAYPLLVDVTADGTLDLFVGDENGSVAIYYNQGTPASPSWLDAPDSTLSAGDQNAVPAVDDLDSDGDPDLLVSKWDGTVSHYENTGTAQVPQWTFRTNNYGGISETEQCLQIAFVDLDADNDRDLLTGLCGQLIWYRRNGLANPTWTRMDSEPVSYGGGSWWTSPGVGDWNGDTEADLVIGEHWGNLRYFHNNGDGTFNEEVRSMPFELLGNSAPALGDWDDDGDLDLLIGQAHGDVYQYTNLGSKFSPDWRDDGILLSIPWTDHPHSNPTFADIDNDQDLDLFIGEGGFQGTGAGGNIHYYRNDGDRFSPNWALQSSNWLGLDVGGWSAPVFADIDVDGDQDLFVGDEDGTLTFVENSGNPNSPLWETPLQPYAGLELGDYSAPSFYDLDQDGDLDMLVGLVHGSLAYIRNAGTADNPTWEPVSNMIPGIDVGERAIPAAGDINGDNLPDLFLGDGDGGLNLYLYDGPGSTPIDGTFAPEDLVQVESTIRLYGPAIDKNTDLNAIIVSGSVALNMLFDQDGRPLPPQNQHGSTRLTAAGLPILHGDQARIWTATYAEITDLRHAGGNMIEGRLDFTVQLPDELPLGIYRPVLQLNVDGLPAGSGWRATSVHSSAVYYNEAALPPIAVVPKGTSANESSEDASSELLWYLLMDDASQGIRGTGPRSQVDSYQAASFIVAQGAPYVVPAVDPHTSLPISYRLEPFLPMNSFSDRVAPAVPRISFQLPGGQLCVTIQEPDGGRRDLGCEAFKQSFQRTATTKGGNLLNDGSVQIDDIYSLTTGTERFVTQFHQFGRHTITMTGTIDDVWGNSYIGGGVYDLWVARPLDIDPGVLPGTPLAVGDAFNPALRLSPGLPADVNLTLIHFPNSDPGQAITYTVSGRTNSYGYFGYDGAPIILSQPGEYRVKLTAIYTDTQNGMQTMGAATWGGIVMTPPAQADLIAHGRRGIDNLEYIPSQWFVTCALNPPPPAGSVPHVFSPYLRGDIIWSRGEQNELCSGFALRLAASVQDTVGTIEAAVENRFHRTHVGLQEPGDFDDRVLFDELPLFSSAYSGRPVQIVPENVDQIAYAYLSAQRPGVRVREVIAEDSHSSGYWRLDSMYDNQPGIGVEGDLPNDYKFQYIGVVYRDLETDHNEYVGLGTGWIHLADDDPTGSRVMPPFSGPGNGGWPTQGGPLLTLKNEAVHMLIYPTGVRPGAVLVVGDRFHFAGHLLPSLDSHVAVTVTAPSGIRQEIGGQANSVGYFYDQADDFTVTEPGLWSVDVVVWHDGQIGSGEQVNCSPADPFNPALPCPSGNILGSTNGRYWFYVVPQATARLNIFAPSTSILTFEDPIQPIAIRGFIPNELSDVTIDYTISMPGFTLEQGQVAPVGNTYQILFDPVALNVDFPNLDLIGRYMRDRSGLADTFTISVLLQGQGDSGPTYYANSLTIQGEQVFVDSPFLGHRVFMPYIGLVAD